MFLLFSRPIEVPGIWAFLFTVIGFVIVSVVTSLLFYISFWLKNETESKKKEFESWLAGFTMLGTVFLIVNLILAIPVMIILFFVQISVIAPAFDYSDETFHKFDNFLTFLWIVINLICYFIAVKIYHRKIYSRFIEKREKQKA